MLRNQYEYDIYSDLIVNKIVVQFFAVPVVENTFLF